MQSTLEFAISLTDRSLFLRAPSRGSHAIGVAMRSMNSREHVRELRKAGMKMGAGFVKHSIFAELSASKFEHGIMESGGRLADNLGESMRLFAYAIGEPGVEYTAGHVEWARKAGYRAATSTHADIAVGACDRMKILRVVP